MELGFVFAAAATLLASASFLPAAAQENASASSASAEVPREADRRLQALYEADWQWQLKEFDRIEEADGSTSAGASLPSVTPQAQERRAAHAREMLEAVNAIPADSLSEKEKVNAAVFRTLQEEAIGDAEFREWEMPFDSDSSFWSYLNARSGFDTTEKYERYIARMRDIPRYFDEQIANSRAGLGRGFSVPRVTLEGRDVSLEPYTNANPEENPFWDAFEDMPQRIPEAEKERLRSEARAAIEEAVVPSYGKLLTFLREEYLPGTRTELAAEKMPDGPAYYQQQIKQYTTLDLTAEQIHEIGLKEVARIEAEMQAIMDEVGFEGTLKEFNASLRTDPRFIADTPDELMGVSAYTAKRVDGKIADYFGFLPRFRFTIRPVPDAIAPFYTSGRGGLEACLMNTYDLPSRPLYNIPALTMHECSPGHSFQAAFALEQEEAPKFRRQTYFSGFGEGWGLYTEYLGREMGIYRTPYERFGQLSYEMWRAVRLVIDTGIHHYGWDRQRAVDYLADRTALSQHEVGTEVDRYISWPGQALAYKLGEMTMRRVRAKAEEALGTGFDIRKFHDTVLSLGSVPLPVLETRIDQFIANGGPGLPGVEYD